MSKIKYMTSCGGLIFTWTEFKEMVNAIRTTTKTQGVVYTIKGKPIEWSWLLEKEQVERCKRLEEKMEKKRRSKIHQNIEQNEGLILEKPSSITQDGFLV